MLLVTCRPKGPPLEYIFSWVSEDQIECQGCHYKALRYEEDMDLSLPISKGFDQQDSPQDVASIQEALSLYTTKEVMDGDNKFSCPCCSSKHGYIYSCFDDAHTVGQCQHPC